LLGTLESGVSAGCLHSSFSHSASQCNAPAWCRAKHTARESTLPIAALLPLLPCDAADLRTDSWGNMPPGRMRAAGMESSRQPGGVVQSGRPRSQTRQKIRVNLPELTICTRCIEDGRWLSEPIIDAFRLISGLEAKL
jgi:hypothetical protein